MLEESVRNLLGIGAEFGPQSDGATYAVPNELIDDPLAGRLQKACLDLMMHEVHGAVLGRLARTLHTSVRQLNRMFQRAGLDSPAREFRRLRLRRVLDRVRTTTISLEVIAEEMGYHDRASFVRAFVRIFGISPASLRQRFKDKSRESDQSGHENWLERT